MVIRPQSPQPDWRFKDYYTRLRGIDRAGLMWEWLRRDPDYGAWQARATVVTGGDRPIADLGSGRLWGLHFRREA